MPFRVVIPRSIPTTEANRVQQAVWRRGYSTRLAGRNTGTREQLVEFLRTVHELPDPGEVAGFEHDLERILTAGRAATTFTGTGAWLETITSRPSRPTRSVVTDR